MIGHIASCQNKFEGTTKVLYKFEGNSTNYGPVSVTLSENGTVYENTIIIPQAKGLYCAYPLDGTNNYGVNSFVSFLAGKTDWSIDCLFRSTNLATTNFILSWVKIGHYEAHFSINTSGQIGFGANGDTIITSGTPIATGIWYHIMVRQDTGKPTQIWLNGVKQILTAANQYNWDGNIQDGYIGRYRLGGGQTFYLKNFRICVPSMKAPRVI